MNRIWQVCITKMPDKDNDPLLKIHVYINKDRFKKILLVEYDPSVVQFTTSEFIGMTLDEAVKHVESKK